jgi:hypothetical protein
LANDERGKIKHPFHVVGNCQDFGEFLDFKKLHFFDKIFFWKKLLIKKIHQKNH